MIAVAARGRLELVDLATCTTRVLARGSFSDVHFSSDGRWLAFSRQAGYVGSTATTGLYVVAVTGGGAQSPLGPGVVAWSWARHDDLLYGITSSGSLVASSLTGQRRVVATGLGATVAGLSLSPAGAQAVVDRSRCRPPALGELDLIDLRNGARTVALRQPGRFVTFAGFSPDGRWLLFWSQDQCAASLAADGMPLDAVPAAGGRPVQAVGHMLLYPDFLSWCGRRLIAAAGSSRETNTASALVQAVPPAWRPRTIRRAGPLSWVSPSCAPSGRVVVAAAGPNTAPVAFGQAHRAIWLLHADGRPIRRLTRPPTTCLSDEAPRFSRNGRWILFVRTRLVNNSALSADTLELIPAGHTGRVVPVIHFTSSDFSYYDHFNWPREIDWYRGSTASAAGQR